MSYFVELLKGDLVIKCDSNGKIEEARKCDTTPGFDIWYDVTPLIKGSEYWRDEIKAKRKADSLANLENQEDDWHYGEVGT